MLRRVSRLAPRRIQCLASCSKAQVYRNIFVAITHPVSLVRTEKALFCIDLSLGWSMRNGTSTTRRASHKMPIRRCLPVEDRHRLHRVDILRQDTAMTTARVVTDLPLPRRTGHSPDTFHILGKWNEGVIHDRARIVSRICHDAVHASPLHAEVARIVEGEH
jgi:hypothetical protein